MHHAIESNCTSNIIIATKHELEITAINKLITTAISSTIYKSVSHKGHLTDLTISYYRSKGYTVEIGNFYAYISWELDLRIGEEILYNQSYYKIDWIYGGKLCLINNESKSKIIINEGELNVK